MSILFARIVHPLCFYGKYFKTSYKFDGNLNKFTQTTHMTKHIDVSYFISKTPVSCKTRVQDSNTIWYQYSFETGTALELF